MTEQDEKSTEKAEDTVLDAVKAAAAELEAVDDASNASDLSEDAPTEEAPDPVEPAEETPDPVLEAVNRPEWFDEGRSGLWEGLSVETQHYLDDTVARLQKAHTEAIEKDRLPDPVRSALRQVEDLAAGYGMAPDVALQRMVQAQKMLDTNSRHAIAQLARDYNVDLSQFAAQPGEQKQADPLAELDDRINKLVSDRLGQHQQQVANREVESTMRDLQAWAEAKDKDGNLLRPDFYDVQHLVKAEADKILADNPHAGFSAIEQAYDTVQQFKGQHQQNVDDLVAKKVEAVLKARSAEAEKARKASVSPAPGPSDTPSVANGSTGSVIDDVRAAAAELTGAARI